VQNRVDQLHEPLGQAEPDPTAASLQIAPMYMDIFWFSFPFVAFRIPPQWHESKTLLLRRGQGKWETDLGVPSSYYMVSTLRVDKSGSLFNPRTPLDCLW
jgi:hypothetical protein